MELTIDQLLRGKATRIKEKEYFTTEQYVVPFLERMSKFTNEFIIQAKPADQISLTPNGDVNFEDIIYNRVNIEAVLPNEYCFEGHKQVVEADSRGRPSFFFHILYRFLGAGSYTLCKFRRVQEKSIGTKLHRDLRRGHTHNVLYTLYHFFGDVSCPCDDMMNF